MSAMAKGDGGTGGIIGETAKQSSKDFRQKEMNVWLSHYPSHFRARAS
jgi:hypothetical protein